VPRGTEEVKKVKPDAQLPILGWREWLMLPQLGVDAIKAKVDTGARSAALHAFDIHIESRGEKQIVLFKVHPLQRNSRLTVNCEAELIEERLVRNSGGIETLRPVIRTAISLSGQSWPIELTLVGRDAMGFRLLLGRESLRRRFLVDPHCSYCCGKELARASRRKRNLRKRKSS
jgi:hypothetical protein